MNKLLTLLLAGFMIAAQASKAEKPFYQNGKADSVKIPAIPAECFWINPPKDFKVIKDNAVSITAGKGTDLYTFVDGNYYVNTAPKLLFVPDSNFIFSARISLPFDSLYDAGAILIYADEANWAKIIFEKLDGKTLGLGSSVIKNRKTDDSYHNTIPKKEVYIKAAKSGKIFNFYYSLDNKDWKLLRTFSFLPKQQVKLGFYAQTPKGNECTVEFADIRYEARSFKNFFTGE